MLKNQPERYFIPKSGNKPEIIEDALRILLDICNKSKTPINAILFVPVKDSLKGTTVAKALGEDRSKILLKNSDIVLPNGGALSLKTRRTLSSYTKIDVILAVYVDEEMLDKVDAIHCSHVIVVPWLLEHTENWVKTWNPKQLGRVEEAEEMLVKSTVVEEGLKWLTRVVNLSTGLVHPQDKGSAVDLFKVLLKLKQSFDPDEIKLWAVRSNWTPKGASQLQDISEKILDGKRLRGGSAQNQKFLLGKLREFV